jgi:hypothetical protein
VQPPQGNDAAYLRTEDQPTKSVTLYANWPAAVPFTVTCSRQDEYFSLVLLIAHTGNEDANPSNNIGAWDLRTGK